MVAGLSARRLLPERCRREPTRAGLIGLIVLILLTSLPGPAWNSWPELVAELHAGGTLAIHEPVLMTILERLATFLPLGVLLQWELARGRRPRRLLAWCALALFALALELAQAPVAGRHTRLSDLLVALGCGTLGILIGAWLGPRPIAPAKRRILVLALLAGVNAIVTCAIVQAQRGAELRGWDCGYPLVVANELTADRPWLGRIRGLAIYDRALSAQQVEELHPLRFSGPGATARTALGSVATFDLAGVATARGSDLRLPPSGWERRDSALAVQRPLLIEGGTVAGRICAQVMQSGALTVEALVASDAPEQEGPARIVSQSVDPFLRNFMLGQDMGALVFRVRTPWSGPNGLRSQLRVESALADRAWHHVVATQARGIATLFLDGREVSAARYDELMALSEARIVRVGWFALVGLAAAGLLATLARPRSTWRGRLAQAYLGAALVPGATAAFFSLRLGHDPDWLLIAVVAVGPALGVLGLRPWSWLKGGKAWRPPASVAGRSVAARVQQSSSVLPVRPPALR